MNETATDAHDSLVECLDDEAWLDDEHWDDATGELEEDGMTILWPVECPICGREYEYTYILNNLFSTNEEQIAKEF